MIYLTKPYIHTMFLRRWGNEYDQLVEEKYRLLFECRCYPRNKHLSNSTILSILLNIVHTKYDTPKDVKMY